MKMTDVIKTPMLMARDKLSGGRAPISAPDLLTMQHREVDMLFARIAASKSGREQRTLVRHLADRLAAHMLIEQELFYPMCRDEADARSMVYESFEEHGVALHELERLAETSTTDATFDAKVKVLKELIRHHVEEEENKLFPKVRRAVSKTRLNELGAKMRQRFEQAIERGGHDAFAGRLETWVEQPNPSAARSRRAGAAASAPKTARVAKRATTGAKKRGGSKSGGRKRTSRR